MVVGLGVFACSCKRMTFTIVWGLAVVATFCLIPTLLFAMAFPSKANITFMMLVFVVFACIYILFDLKLIMEYLSMDEYIVGALILYVDIIYLFLKLLQLLGKN